MVNSGRLMEDVSEGFMILILELKKTEPLPSLSRIALWVASTIGLG